MRASPGRALRGPRLWWPRRPLATLGRKSRQGRKAATVSIDAGAEASRRGRHLFPGRKNTEAAATRRGACDSVRHRPALPVVVELQPRAAFEHEGVLGDAAVVGAGARIQDFHPAVDALALAVDRGIFQRPCMRLPVAAPGHALAPVAGVATAQLRRERGAIPFLPGAVA